MKHQKNQYGKQTRDAEAYAHCHGRILSHHAPQKELHCFVDQKEYPLGNENDDEKQPKILAQISRAWKALKQQFRKSLSGVVENKGVIVIRRFINDNKSR